MYLLLKQGGHLLLVEGGALLLEPITIQPAGKRPKRVSFKPVTHLWPEWEKPKSQDEEILMLFMD